MPLAVGILDGGDELIMMAHSFEVLKSQSCEYAFYIGIACIVQQDLHF